MQSCKKLQCIEDNLSAIQHNMCHAMLTLGIFRNRPTRSGCNRQIRSHRIFYRAFDPFGMRNVLVGQQETRKRGREKNENQNRRSTNNCHKMESGSFRSQRLYPNSKPTCGLFRTKKYPPTGPAPSYTQ